MRGVDAIGPDLPLDVAEPVDVPTGARAPLLPRLTPRRDHVLPILIALSLVVHATVILPSLLRDRDPPPQAPTEVPVEIIQLPPKAPPKPPAPQPKPGQAARPDAAKPQQEVKSEQDKAKQAARQQAKTASPHRPQTARAQPHSTEPQKQAQERQRRDEQRQEEQRRDEQRQEQMQMRQAAVAERMRRLLGTPPPGMDATALPGTSADGAIDVTYTQLVLSQVAKAKKEGKFHGTPGAASVSFVVGDRGELTSVEITRPSGDPSLDEEAVAMIRRAAPFPAPPPGGRRDYTVTLMFKPIS